MVKDLCNHSTDLNPELLSLTRDAFLEDMSSRAAGYPPITALTRLPLLVLSSG